MLKAAVLSTVMACHNANRICEGLVCGQGLKEDQTLL